MKVKVLTDFRDRTADLTLRKAGEVLEADKARAEKLINMGLAEQIHEPTKKKIKDK